ncbi:DUF6316 family protein [Aliikangiella coralliicola]|uniref:DUF6316 domain-containing protein n=1 Tax=Aliikangiella coralliicola TaxID=2592383 RepID=A0A545U6D2_9GAMM|nr:DUF6316 family protein [Aliikangiella coralliicola]TQV85029.1 hypothetical protein FLL46_21810 [Aliikangiella coralliicola]
MNRAIHRKTDSLNKTYAKTQRIIINDRGVFYKVRGGKLNGPFETEADARNDLKVFMQVVEIEEQLDTEDLRIFS